MTDEPRTDAVPGATTVRLSSLCARPVIDERGRPRGTVLDVRVVRDGPVNVSGDAAFRIDGLVVGPNGWAERLGLFRATVRGPWLLKAAARRLGPARCYVQWSQVIDPLGIPDGSEVRFTGELGPLPDQARS